MCPRAQVHPSACLPAAFLCSQPPRRFSSPMFLLVVLSPSLCVGCFCRRGWAPANSWAGSAIAAAGGALGERFPPLIGFSPSSTKGLTHQLLAIGFLQALQFEPHLPDSPPQARLASSGGGASRPSDERLASEMGRCSFHGAGVLTAEKMEPRWSPGKLHPA